MANYNPHSPVIVGEEWVPIRQANYQPDSISERGYTWHINHSSVVVSGSYTVADVPPAFTVNTAILQAVYLAGTEDHSGPIQQIVIPVDGVRVTGDAAVSTGVAPWLSPNDSQQSFLYSDLGSGPTELNDGFGLSFDVASYTNALTDKRILNVELLYTVNGDPLDVARVAVSIARAWDSGLSGTNSFTYQLGMEGPPFEVANTRINSVSFGSLNPFWSAALGTFTTAEVFPWRYTELALLDASSTPANTKLTVMLQWADSDPPLSGVTFNYAALRITYCEERRLLYGGRRAAEGITISADAVGLTVHRFLTPAFAFGATLAPNDYVITNTFEAMSTVPIVDDDSAGVNTQTPITLGAIRQLDEMVSLRGRQINKSLVANEQFNCESIDVIPGIYLYTGAGIVTGSHAYAQQIYAPVYSGVSPIQEIVTNPLGATTNGPFAWARFYARRFNDSLPLLLTETGSGTILAIITAEDFDELPEIIDGWREVTLELPDPTYSSTVRNFRWDSTGPAGNRWEILGAAGLNTSSTYVNTPATYLAPNNPNAVELSWKQPNQSSVTTDQSSDAMLILSPAAPAVTGFAVGTCSQTLTTVSDCRVPAPCIPTHILGNSLSWTASGVCDTAERTVAAGSLGRTNTGQSWTLSGGASSTWSVDGESIVNAMAAITTDYFATVAFNIPNGVAYGEVTVPDVATGGSFQAALTFRKTDDNNFYFATARFETTDVVTVILAKEVAGAQTTLFSLSSTMPYGDLDTFAIKARFNGSQIGIKVWNKATMMEPVDYFLVTDTSFTSGSVGLYDRLNTSSTNTLPFSLKWDNLKYTPIGLEDATLEIQRADTVETDFATIAELDATCFTSMCDYEARAGVVSSYRARYVNALDFPGDWTSELTITLASPGVSGVGTGNSTLIFTSNQDASASLAYTMVWDGEVREDFNFPEAGFQQLRTQYNRDFFVAFRPTERGGEQFTRTILVNAAAIPPESLADFRGLRDLAWEDLPYVCVRDELGNRWLANVSVPNGRVRNNRRLYYAEVLITEVTETPAPYTGA